VPELVKLFNDPGTQAAWAPITSLDPRGMDANRPTISGTPANMEVPEIMGRLRRDGKIVNDDGSIKVVKVAIDPVWHLPKVAAAVGVDEKDLRNRLSRWTQNETILDEDNKVRLPSSPCFFFFLLLLPSSPCFFLILHSCSSFFFLVLPSDRWR
jgi:hypothetical protein